MIDSTNLVWRERGNAFTLHLYSSKKTILSVEPDAAYPRMWRIHHRGRVSDMANLSRAKDAAIGIAGRDRSLGSRFETLYGASKGPTPVLFRSMVAQALAAEIVERRGS